MKIETDYTEAERKFEQSKEIVWNGMAKIIDSEVCILVAIARMRSKLCKNTSRPGLAVEKALNQARNEEKQSQGDGDGPWV